MRISMSLLLTASLLWTSQALATPSQPVIPPADQTGDIEQAIPLEETVTVVSEKPADPVAMALEARFDAKPKALSLDNRRDWAGVAAFYEQANYAPLWIEDGRLNTKARQVIFFLKRSSQDGLNPDDYRTPPLSLGMKEEADFATLAKAESDLSHAIVTYARHAQAGRVRPKEVSKTITLTPVKPDPVEVVERIADADDPRTILKGFQPQHEGYKRLKAQLAQLRATPVEKTHQVIPSGKALKLGTSDPRVALLRERLNVPTETNAALFDEALLDAVKTFQTQRDLHVDGIVGRQTLAVLNGKKALSEADIIANMEMWRWLPRDLGQFHVFVNVPEYRLRVFKDDKQTHTTRVVVGKFRNKTPIFSDEIEHVVVNPYWNVPASIAVKELLPQIRRNPRGYLAKRNYQVLTKVKGRVRVVDPRRVNWSKFNANRVRIRQAPGGGNALGRIKFLFPNKHAVYLHDTPSKSLFSKQRRAFSHGCIRVHKPFEFAEALFAESAGWNKARLQSMLGNKERWVNLEKHVPVHLAYFTLRVNDDGDLNAFDDVYGHMASLKAKLER